MDGLHRLVKEKLRIKYYTRYMDDIVMIHRDKDFLRECLKTMTEFVEQELQLEFNEKTQIHSISQGVDYLGFHFYMTNNGKIVRKLRQSNKRRFKRKLKKYKELYKKGEIELEDIRRSLVSYKGI